MAHQRFGPGPVGAGNEPIVGSGTSAVGPKSHRFWRNKGTRRRAAGRMSRRILVVAPQPFFTPRGTPFSVYYRTLVSSELGFEVDLLTYGQGEDIALPGVRLIRAPAFAWLGPVKTARLLPKPRATTFPKCWLGCIDSRDARAKTDLPRLLRLLFAYRPVVSAPTCDGHQHTAREIKTIWLIFGQATITWTCVFIAFISWLIFHWRSSFDIAHLFQTSLDQGVARVYGFRRIRSGTLLGQHVIWPVN